MKRELTQHTETNNSTYGFNLLNDKQRASICGEFDFMHCAIDEDLQGGTVMMFNGETTNFKLSLRGVK